MIVLEPSDKLLQSRIVLELQAVPQRPFCVTKLILRRRDRLRETEERQSEVNKSVLVFLEFVLAINDLIGCQRSVQNTLHNVGKKYFIEL